MAMRRKDSTTHHDLKRSSEILQRNSKVFIGHDASNGQLRRIAGQGAGPSRPSSSHLALGRFRRPDNPDDTGGIEEESKETADLQTTKRVQACALAAHTAQRCDDLERLLVRKIVSKQPLHGARHQLQHCQACTDPAPNFHHNRVKNARHSESKYAHEQGTHRHTQRPHPMPPGGRLVKARASLNQCTKLQRSSTWRTLEDMAAVGRLPPPPPPAAAAAAAAVSWTTSGGGGPGSQGAAVAMQLPSQRTTQHQQLRKAVKSFFSSAASASSWAHRSDKQKAAGAQYLTLTELANVFDDVLGLPSALAAADGRDGRGGGGVTAQEKEMRLQANKVRAAATNHLGVDDHVLKVLLRRYCKQQDISGDDDGEDGDEDHAYDDDNDADVDDGDGGGGHNGNHGAGSKGGRVLLEQVVDRVMFVVESDEIVGSEAGTTTARPTREALKARRVEEVEMEVDALEREWVTRLAKRAKCDLPSALRTSFRDNLRAFDLEGGGQWLDCGEIRKLLSGNFPRAPRSHLDALLARYGPVEVQNLTTLNEKRDEKRVSMKIRKTLAVDRMVQLVLLGGFDGHGGNQNNGGGGGKTTKELTESGDNVENARLGGGLERPLSSKVELLESALVECLRVRMGRDGHLGLRQCLKKLFLAFGNKGSGVDDGSSSNHALELSYRELLLPLKLLLNPLEDPRQDRALKEYVRGLDTSKKGTVSFGELNDRMIQGFRRLGYGQAAGSAFSKTKNQNSGGGRQRDGRRSGSNVADVAGQSDVWVNPHYRGKKDGRDDDDDEENKTPRHRRRPGNSNDGGDENGDDNDGDDGGGGGCDELFQAGYEHPPASRAANLLQARRVDTLEVGLLKAMQGKLGASFTASYSSTRHSVSSCGGDDGNLRLLFGAAKKMLAAFAVKRHPGTVVAVNDDGTLDVEHTPSPAEGHVGEDTGHLVFQGVPKLRVLPVGEFLHVEGKGQNWVAAPPPAGVASGAGAAAAAAGGGKEDKSSELPLGQSLRLGVGSTCTFGMPMHLSRGELAEALKTLVPPSATSDQLSILASRFYRQSFAERAAAEEDKVSGRRQRHSRRHSSSSGNSRPRSSGGNDAHEGDLSGSAHQLGTLLPVSVVARRLAALAAAQT